ncbi:MAG: choline/ethanolamine kinase family protein [Steroidobacteraceae bacterium]
MTTPVSLPPALAVLLQERLKAELFRAEKLEGGVCNVVWRLPTADGLVAVRIGEPSALQWGASRHSELAALEAAYPMGPAVLMADPEAGWLVTEWIHGRHWSREEAGETANLQRIARLLASLHALAPPGGVRRLTLRSTLAALGAEPDPTTEAWLTALEEGAQIGLCHNDPHHRNILVDDHTAPRLVDWEYAGIGEVAIDLAEYANVHQLQERERRLLLDAYRAAGGRVSQLQFEAAGYLCQLRTALWESLASKKQS